MWERPPSAIRAGSQGKRHSLSAVSVRKKAQVGPNTKCLNRIAHALITARSTGSRPVHSWNEQEVWNIIRRYQLNAHPSYRIGFPRLSCRACIFGLEDQWASLRQVDPAGFQTIAAYETQCWIHNPPEDGYRISCRRRQALCRLFTSVFDRRSHGSQLERTDNPSCSRVGASRRGLRQGEGPS
jgi:3'-phosphoadenosine 5'-phosphosulfate sulfotransferase (PAPS reductase)/FAD synthetase